MCYSYRHAIVSVPLDVTYRNVFALIFIGKWGKLLMRLIGFIEYVLIGYVAV